MGIMEIASEITNFGKTAFQICSMPGLLTALRGQSAAGLAARSHALLLQDLLYLVPNDEGLLSTKY